MSTTLADRFATPEEAIVALRHQRTIRMIIMIVGMITALCALFGAGALMYSDDTHVPKAAAPPK